MPTFSIPVPLNRELLLRYFIYRPFSQASQDLLTAKDRLKVRVASIALAVFTLTIGLLLGRYYFYNRRTIAPSNLLRMQKAHFVQKFSRSDQNKINMINGFSNLDFVKFKQQYEWLESEKVKEFSLKNKERINSKSLSYICAYEVLGLIKNQKYGEILKLESECLSSRHMHLYRQCLIDSLSNPKMLVEKMVHSPPLERGALFEACFARKFDFTQFKELYYSLPKSLSQELLQSGLSKKVKMLAFACDLLTCLDSPKMDSKAIFRIIDLAVVTLGPINYNDQEYLRSLLYPLVSHRKINIVISCLIVEKGSPLHSSTQEIKEELLQTILQLGSVRKFTLSKEMILKLKNAEKSLFTNNGEVQFKIESVDKAERLIKNFALLKEKVTREHGRFCDIDLRKMGEDKKSHLYEYLSQEKVDFNKIVFRKPGILQYSLSLAQFGENFV